MKLRSVTEPSMCAYHAVIMHPGACTTELLDKLQRQDPQPAGEEPAWGPLVVDDSSEL